MSDNTATIILDTKKMTVTRTSNGELIPAYRLGWDSSYSSPISDGKPVSDIYWLRLLEGNNKLKITGDCVVKIKTKYPRKVGQMYE